MGAMEFWAEIIKAVAWPVAIVVSVGILRKPLRAILTEFTGLFGRAESLSAGFGSTLIEMKLTEATQKVREVNEESEATQTAAQPVNSSDTDRLRALLASDPKSAILFAYVDVEIAAHDAAARFAPAFANRDTIPSLRVSMTYLDQHVGVDEATLSGAKYLSRVRRKVAHGVLDDQTSDIAGDYVSLAAEVKASLNRLRPENPTAPTDSK